MVGTPRPPAGAAEAVTVSRRRGCGTLPTGGASMQRRPISNCSAPSSGRGALTHPEFPNRMLGALFGGDHRAEQGARDHCFQGQVLALLPGRRECGGVELLAHQGQGMRILQLVYPV